MAEISEIKSKVKAYLFSEFLEEEDYSDLSDKTPLISTGILDSISTLKMVSYLEETYQIEFEAHEVDQDNLDSLDNIANFVLFKLN